MTIDLPDNLVKAVKYRAVRDGRKLKDVMTDVIVEGLRSENRSSRLTETKEASHIGVNPRTGLPVIHGSPDAPALKMSIEQLLEMEQRVQEEEDLQRVGLLTGR